MAVRTGTAPSVVSITKIEMYYNTTNVKNPQLDLYTQTAKTQDERVMALMIGLKKAGATIVYKSYCNLYDNQILKSSIRRSLSTLKNKGKLEITEERDLGPHGRPEWIYQLKSI